MIDKDVINSAFQICATFFVFNNVWVLYKEKKIAGVSIMTALFWTVWGLWNIWYFQALYQPLSAITAILLFVGNLIWVVLAIRYRKLS